jgi:ribulose-5-phosphate 4-epimerase/fuculose-1-phosphate aldolase
MLETIGEIFREGYQRGWVTTRDGNASLRYNTVDHFHITPKGVRKQTLQPDMFKKIGIGENSWYEMEYTNISAQLEPSGEIPMHWGLQRKINTDVRVVLHMHPTYTNAAMYRGIDLQKLVDEFPELSRYTSVGPTVPMIPPITQELADACIENIGVQADGSLKYNIIGMDRHGVIAVDTSPWRAFEHMERLEHICRIVLAAS